MLQMVLIGTGAGAAAALLFASVDLRRRGVDAAVLPRAAADPDRRRSAGAIGRRWSPRFTASAGLGIVLRRHLLPRLPRSASACPRGGSAISRCWRVRETAAPLHRRGLEWYPPGRLVVWAGVLAALVVIVAIPNFGIDADTFRTGLRTALGDMFTGGPADGQLSETALRDLNPADRVFTGRGGGNRRHYQRLQPLACPPASSNFPAG